METPFLDQLIEEHQKHIESVEAASYVGIPETRKQLAELEVIKAIIVKHCCKSDSELLKHDNIKLDSKVEITLTEKHNCTVVWLDGEEIGVEDENRAYTVSKKEITKVF